MNVKVKKMIDDIRDTLILLYGEEFLRLPEKDQVELMIHAFNEARTEA